MHIACLLVTMRAICQTLQCANSYRFPYIFCHQLTLKKSDENMFNTKGLVTVTEQVGWDTWDNKNYKGHT